MTENWEDLTKEEQKVWNKLAKENQVFLQVFKYIMEHHCHMCRYKPKNWGDFVFHMQSTHGIRKGDLYQMINDLNKKYAHTQ